MPKRRALPKKENQPREEKHPRSIRDNDTYNTLNFNTPEQAERMIADQAYRLHDMSSGNYTSDKLYLITSGTIQMFENLVRHHLTDIKPEQYANQDGIIPDTINILDKRKKQILHKNVSVRTIIFSKFDTTECNEEQIKVLKECIDAYIQHHNFLVMSAEEEKMEETSDKIFKMIEKQNPEKKAKTYKKIEDLIKVRGKENTYKL